MRGIIEVDTESREELLDITDQVRKIVRESGVTNGLVSLFVQGSTAALMIQENWDDSVPRDVVGFLAGIIPRGVWLHDQQDGNGDAHLKAGMVGPSETIPIINGKVALGRWQNIFLCEFDGPRSGRSIVCTVLTDGG